MILSSCKYLGRELSVKGNLLADTDAAYQFLKHAETGYKTEPNNGNMMYERSYTGVVELLNDPQFDEIRKKYDELYSETDASYDEL